MNWANPHYLWLLLLVPIVALLLAYAERRRRAATLKFLDAPMAARLVPQVSAGRRRLKAVALLLGLTCLIVAAARPRWGMQLEEVATRGVDLFVLLDVSRSMTAEDVTPSRLERAKLDIRDLLDQLGGDRVGLIAFAGQPVVKVPLTTDQNYFRLLLDELDTNSAPRGGSLIGDAIREGLRAMPPRGDRDQALVLITDGEDQESLPIEAAQAAAARGVKIIAVGLGDPREGARIPLADRPGATGFVQHEGQEHWSKLNQDLLRQIATITGGEYIPAQTQAYDLGSIYADHLAHLRQGEIATEQRQRHQERFQWFTLAGLALLLTEMLIPNAARVPQLNSPESGS